MHKLCDFLCEASTSLFKLDFTDQLLGRFKLYPGKFILRL